MKPEYQLKIDNMIPIPQSDDSHIATPPIPIFGDPSSIEQSIVQAIDIKGSAFPSTDFDSEFRPKSVTPRLKQIWIYTCLSDRTTLYPNHISLAKMGADYYVIDGLQRVSAMKHQGWEKANFEVQDYSHLLKLPHSHLDEYLQKQQLKFKELEKTKLEKKRKKARAKRKRKKERKKLLKEQSSSIQEKDPSNQSTKPMNKTTHIAKGTKSKPEKNVKPIITKTKPIQSSKVQLRKPTFMKISGIQKDPKKVKSKPKS